MSGFEKLQSELEQKEYLDSLNPEQLRIHKSVVKAVKELKPLDSMMKDGIPKMSWRIQNILPERGITIIGSSPGGYKTYLAQLMGLCVANGKNFLDIYQTTQAPVLYVDEENGEIRLARGFGQLCTGHSQPYTNKLFMSIYQGIKLDTNLWQILDSLIEETKAGLIVIDSLARFLEGDEDKAKDVRKIFENLKVMLEKHNVCFLILHHLSKARYAGMNSLRGSGDLSAMCDVLCNVNNRHKGYIEFGYEKNRHVDMAELSSFKIDIVSEHEDSICFEHAGVVTGRKLTWEMCQENLEEWILKNKMKDFKTGQAVKQSTQHGYSRKAVNDALNNMNDEGLILNPKRGFWEVVPGKIWVQEEIVSD